MIWECFFMVGLLGTGLLLLRLCGYRGSSWPALGFILGLCVYVATSLLQVIFQLPSYPVLTFTLVGCLNAGCYALLRQRNRPSLDAGEKRVLFGSVFGLIGIVVALRFSNLVTWHTDSFRYAMTSALIADSHVVEMSSNLLTKRMFAFPALHAPALLIGEHYFRSLAPVLAISTTWMLGAFIHQGLRLDGAVKSVQGAISLAGVALLVSNNRFLWNAFYVNGHLLCATAMLTVAGSGWLRARDAAPRATYGLLQNLAIPVLVTTRPEGLLLAALAILPSISSNKLTTSERALLLTTLGAVGAGWHGYVTYLCWTRGALEGSSFGLFALGVLSLAAAALVRTWQPLTRWLPSVLVIAEALLWIGLVGFSIVRPNVMRLSIAALWQNVGMDAASWGSSILVLAALVAGTLLFTRAPERAFLRFPVTTFLPLVLLLAPVRGAAYRVGNWDSLSRMLIHIVPLSVLLIASSATGRWHLPFRSWIASDKSGRHNMFTHGNT